MTLPVVPAARKYVDLCERCGTTFPHQEASENGHTLCEPCRDALWRDERGLAPRE